MVSSGSKPFARALSTVGADICSSEESDNEDTSDSKPVCFTTRKKRWHNARFQSLIDHLRFYAAYPTLNSGNIMQSVESTRLPPASLPFSWYEEIFEV